MGFWNGRDIHCWLTPLSPPPQDRGRASQAVFLGRGITELVCLGLSRDEGDTALVMGAPRFPRSCQKPGPGVPGGGLDSLSRGKLSLLVGLREAPRGGFRGGEAGRAAGICLAAIWFPLTRSLFL